MNGYQDGTFRPDAAVTRGELAAMLARALKLPDGAGLAFADANAVPGWAQGPMAAAVQAGLFGGFEDGTIRAQGRMTRAQIAAIVVRAKGLALDPSAPLAFADADEAPAWARTYIAACAKAGLVAGRGGNRFAPNEDVTRAEAVALILKLLE